MRILIVVLAIFVLITMASGSTEIANEKVSENSITVSENMIAEKMNSIDSPYSGQIKKINKKPTKIFRGSFELGGNTNSLATGDIDSKLRSLLSNNLITFGIKQGDLKLSSSYITEKSDGLSILKYVQEYNGLTVYSSRVIAAVRNGKVVTLKSDYYNDININTKSSLGEKDILNIVETDAGIYIDKKNMNIDGLKNQKSSKTKKETISAEDISLIVYPENTDTGTEYHLAYEIDLGLIRSIPAKWTYVVDANNGKILEKYNRVVYSTLNGKATGSVYPESPIESPVTKNFSNMTLFDSKTSASNVFWSGKGNSLGNSITTKNPVSLSGVSSATLEFKTKYSIEEGYDFGYATISTDGINYYWYERYTGNLSNWSTRNIDLSGFAGKQIWLGFYYFTDSSVQYDGMYIDDIKIETNAGTKFSDSGNSLTNWNNVGFSIVAQNVDNYSALGNTGSNGSYSLSGLPVSFVLHSEFIGPYVHVYNYSGINEYLNMNINTPSTQNINWGPYDRSYKKEQSNVFYHTNVVRDFFTKGDPFNIYGMNYQTIAYVQYGGYCNAFADGVNLHFFGEGNGCEATSLLSDVIYHEYTHNVVDHVYSTVLPYIAESGAMNEGWADYFASSINGNPCMAQGFFIGSTDCLRNLSNSYRYPEDILGEVHDDSRIVAGASWDLKQMIGVKVTDDLVINAMKLEPFTFAEYMEDVIVADDDNANPGDGTPHLYEICTAFYKNHGIPSSFCNGYYPVPQTLNLLKNPGFESGNANWIKYSNSGNPIFYNAYPYAHYGTWLADMGWNNNSNEYIYQDVTIPSGDDLDQVYVRFWYWIYRNQNDLNRADNDVMNIEIRDPGSDALLRSIDTLSNLNWTYGFIISNKYDISEFKGQKVRLKFHVITDPGYLTGFSIDDTELTVVYKSIPHIDFVPPTPLNNSIIRKNWIFVNTTSDDSLTTALLQWNGVNESMQGGGMNWYKNKTDLPEGRYDFTVWGQNNSGNWRKSEKRTVTINTSHSVLIIDDDNDIYSYDDQSVSAFRSAFEGLGYNVKIENASETSNLTWNNYEILVWSSGDDLTPLNNAQYKSMLVHYVNNGGHLILESGNIAAYIKQQGGQAIDADFRTKVLHITNDWVYSDVGDLTLSTSHPISAGLPSTIGFTPTNPGDDSGDADAVRILPDATGVYNWSYVGYGGVPINESIARISFGVIASDDDSNAANGGQIVYYAFDVDDIDSPDIIQTLIKNSGKWLGSIPPPQLNVIISESPDPVNSSMNSTVTVIVTSGGAAVSGANVTVSATGGSLIPVSGTTDANGKFITTYIAPFVNTTTNYTISAISAKTGFTSGSGSDMITVIPACWAPTWDVNQDGKVNVQDLVIIGQHFGEIYNPPPFRGCDVNRDGRCNVQDLVIVGQHFGETTCYWIPP